jgi:hypothetical protein
MSNLIKEEISRINELMGVHNKTNINEDRGDYVNALKTILGKTERELADEDILRRALSDALNNPSIRKQITSVTYDVTKRALGDSFAKIENKIYKDLLSGVPLKTVNTNMDNLINSMVASGSIKGLTPEMATALKQELKDRATKISKGKTAEEVFGRKISKPKSKTPSSTTGSTSKVTQKLAPELDQSLLDLASAFKELPGFEKYLSSTVRRQLIKQYQKELTDPKKFAEIYQKASKNIDTLIAEAKKRKDFERLDKLNKAKNVASGTFNVITKGLSKETLGKIINKYTVIPAVLIAAVYYWKDLYELYYKKKAETGQVNKESEYMSIPGWDELPKDGKDFIISQMEHPDTDFPVSDIKKVTVNSNEDKITLQITNGRIFNFSKLSSGWKIVN